ncbi:MAG TPA: hypothetical protein VIJ92_06115 [Ginsengibacter sp.]
MKFILFFLLYFITFCPIAFSQVRLDSGLVAYYPFNGNANDANGHGNNAIFNNATLNAQTPPLGYTSYINIGLTLTNSFEKILLKQNKLVVDGLLPLNLNQSRGMYWLKIESSKLVSV